MEPKTNTATIAALTVGIILGASGGAGISAATAAVKDGVELARIEPTALHIGFAADGGCLGTVSSRYRAAEGDLSPSVQPQTRDYDGPRCDDAKAFMAKAASLDYLKDNGKP